MDPVYLEIRRIARRIAARLPQPDFYTDHPEEVKASLHFYRSDATIVRLHRKMARCLEDDFGHGMGHVEKVALDAGALTLIESHLKGHGEQRGRRTLLLAQCAGLLHDICRKEKFHAEKGARKAAEILKRYPLSDDEVGRVCSAIRNHEAFAPVKEPESISSGMISDCLYDADKFRWGPDNFNHTLWDMVDYLDPPLSRFMDHYPEGMAMLKKIRSTFRSQTGRRYGPQFIDMGIAIGEELYRVILSDFVDLD
jgi:hypothetical protein